MEAGDTTQTTETESQVQDTGTTEGTESQESSTPDVSEQLAAITQRLDQAFPQQEGQQQQEVGDQDLFNLLTAEDGSDEGDYGYADEGVSQGDEQPVDQDEAIAAFNDAVRERVAESVEPYIEALEMQRRETAWGQLQQEFPQLKERETVEAIRGQLQYLAQASDNPALATDPVAGRLALKAYLADRAAASEVSAEQARGQGASLETGAGTGADGEASQDDQIKAGILGAATSGGYFA